MILPTSVRRAVGLSALIGSTLLSTARPAHAAARGAFIWDGEYWGFDYTSFEAGLTSGGANPVERGPTLPAELAPFNLVIVVLPPQAPSATESGALLDFVGRGGTLMLVSDAQGYAPEVSPIFNQLLAASSIATRFEQGPTYGCSSDGAVHPHALTQGLTTFVSSAPDQLALGPQALPLFDSPDGTVFGAVERNVVMLGDSNPINDVICSPARINAPFYAALPAFACDVDGDGAPNASCDGGDPDDLDASVIEPGDVGTGGGAAGGAAGSGGASTSSSASGGTGIDGEDASGCATRPNRSSWAWGPMAVMLAAWLVRRRNGRP